MNTLNRSSTLWACLLWTLLSHRIAWIRAKFNAPFDSVAAHDVIVTGLRHFLFESCCGCCVWIFVMLFNKFFKQFSGLIWKLSSIQQTSHFYCCIIVRAVDIFVVHIQSCMYLIACAMRRINSSREALICGYVDAVELNSILIEHFQLISFELINYLDAIT